MQLSQHQLNEFLIITAKGRLDANWAEYFTDFMLEQIRQGNHQLIVDAEEMDFLSSAGIRALVRVAKELMKVKGSFAIYQATPFVSKTIEMTGFKTWLIEKLPIEQVNQQNSLHQKPHLIYHETDAAGHLQLKHVLNWKFPLAANNNNIHRLDFPGNTFALGIGSPANEAESCLHSAGEFLAACGQLIFQPPELKSKPDYLLSEGDYIPEISALQAIYLTGSMRGLIRFTPPEGEIRTGLAALAAEALALSESSVAAMLILAETDGLVGAQLIHEVADRNTSDWPEFPEIRDWLSFSGEKVYPTHQALVFGVVSNQSHTLLDPLMHTLPSSDGLKGHFHAAVFPYQPLQNGNIGIQQSINKFLNGPPPLALLHLIDDNRPVSGLGESSFVRGACWFSPIILKEDKL